MLLDMAPPTASAQAAPDKPLLRGVSHEVAAVFALCGCRPAGAGGSVLLALVWSGALAGIVLSVAWPKAPKWLLAVVCIALGWVVVPGLPALEPAHGWRRVGVAARGR